MYRYYARAYGFHLDIHHPFFAFQFLQNITDCRIEICASRASVDLLARFCRYRVPESRICYGGGSVDC